MCDWCSPKARLRGYHKIIVRVCRAQFIMAFRFVLLLSLCISAEGSSSRSTSLSSLVSKWISVSQKLPSADWSAEPRRSSVSLPMVEEVTEEQLDSSALGVPWFLHSDDLLVVQFYRGLPLWFFEGVARKGICGAFGTKVRFKSVNCGTQNGRKICARLVGSKVPSVLVFKKGRVVSLTSKTVEGCVWTGQSAWDFEAYLKALIEALADAKKGEVGVKSTGGSLPLREGRNRGSRSVTRQASRKSINSSFRRGTIRSASTRNLLFVDLPPEGHLTPDRKMQKEHTPRPQFFSDSLPSGLHSFVIKTTSSVSQEGELPARMVNKQPEKVGLKTGWLVAVCVLSLLALAGGVVAYYYWWRRPVVVTLHFTEVRQGLMV